LIAPDSESSARNVSETAKETFAIVKERAADVFVARRSDPAERGDARRAFTRSDRGTGGALWMLCARAAVAGGVLAAFWTCARPWFGYGDSGSGGNPGFPPTRRGGSRRPPGGGSFPKPRRADEGGACELLDHPAAAKEATLPAVPKRGTGKSSPPAKPRASARRGAEAPF
jgi:hypothetical protein